MKNETLQKAILTSSVLCALLSLGGFFLGSLSWVIGLWIGAAWGIFNGFILSKLGGLFFAENRGRFGWKLTGLIALKFIGLYGVAAWLLIGLRIDPVAWLVGFTASLIAFTFNYKQVAA